MWFENAARKMDGSIIDGLPTIVENGIDVIDLDSSGICLKESSIGSTSKGNQRKYTDTDNGLWYKEQFYYQGKYWDDWKVECIAYEYAKHMNTSVKCMQVYPAKYRGRYGVLSEFVDGVFVSINHMLSFKDVPGITAKMSAIDRFSLIRDVAGDYTGVDVTEYLLVLMVLDYLVLNEDRHLNNIGLWYRDGKYFISPVFDFGLGLFEHDDNYLGMSYRSAMNKVVCKPYGSTHLKAIAKFINAGYGDIIDRLFSSVDNVSVSHLAQNKIALEHINLSLSAYKEIALR